jgi:DNA uptake protein ComE-like DNA-binding protein
MNNILKQYFHFSKKELILFFILVIVITGFIVYPKYFDSKKTPNSSLSSFHAPSNVVKNQGIKEKDRYINKQEDYAQNYSTQNDENSLSPFLFDPNTLDEIGFSKLGLREKTIKTILNYRKKGGKFYKPEDFRKIWGLRKQEADILVPYIVIANTANNYQYKNQITPNSNVSIPKIICINTATAFELKALPAVGNVAYRIVNFREKLGGFISVNQVAETYGLSDSVFKQIQPFLTITNTSILKQDINLTSEFELAKHPYIPREVARAIVIYRTQHGQFKTVDDLKKIVFLKSEIIEKMKPYLTVKLND